MLGQLSTRATVRPIPRKASFPASLIVPPRWVVPVQPFIVPGDPGGISPEDEKRLVEEVAIEIEPIMRILGQLDAKSERDIVNKTATKVERLGMKSQFAIIHAMKIVNTAKTSVKAGTSPTKPSRVPSPASKLLPAKAKKSYQEVEKFIKARCRMKAYTIAQVKKVASDWGATGQQIEIAFSRNLLELGRRPSQQCARWLF